MCVVHRERLVGGDWLNDSHIEAASKHNTHRSRNGGTYNIYGQSCCRSNTLTRMVSDRPNIWPRSSNGGQVVWTLSRSCMSVGITGCASNALSSPGVRDIYDSMPASYSSTFTRQVAAITNSPEPLLRMRYINVQMQTGASDCGRPLCHCLCCGTVCREGPTHFLV